MAEENVTNKIEDTEHTKAVQDAEDMQSNEKNKKKKESKTGQNDKGHTYSAIRQWLKIPAMIVCILSVFGVLISGTGMLVMWGSDLRENEIQTEMEEMLLETYGCILLQDTGMLENADVKDGLDGLDGGSIRYTVTRAKNGQKETVLYSNDSGISGENCRKAVSTADSSINYKYAYNTGTFSELLASIWMGKGYYVDPFRYEEGISEFVFTEDQGLLYCHAGENYFLLPEFTLNVYDGGFCHYQLTQTDGKYCYVSEDEQTEDKVADADTIRKWMDGEYGILIQDEPVDFVVADSKDFQNNPVMEYGKDYTDYNVSVYDGTIYCHMIPEGGENIYSVYLSLGDIEAGKTLNNGVKDYFWQAKKLSAFVSGILRYHGVLIVISLLIFCISFFYLLAEAGKRDEENRLVLRIWDKMPFGIFTFLAGGLFLFVLLVLIEGMYEFAQFVIFSPVIGIAILTFLIWLAIVYCMSIAARIKAKKFWRYTVLYYLLQPLRMIGRELRSNTPLFIKGILILTGISFIEICVLATGDFGVISFFFILYKAVEYLALIHVLYQINQIDKGGMRTAAGNYSEPVPTRHMFWEFKRIAENINHVSDGISLAVEEKMKSERFKTELITNVSHDIKTPLTSIINYVDLIKKEEITSAAMQEYVEVLDRQSLRLKKLIEDLMEASKASTGNLPVHMELCDATVMLTQVIGEFKERAEQNQLELVVESPKPPVSIMADGRHLWRVIDNLMSNICKYAMPGTRVYITLEQFHGMVIMTFRNISKSKLNISSEELMERFVRGDSSRNTEGSGLGLSIAQSLTGLMDGNMAIQIDGDLFKAIVSFCEVNTGDKEN